MMNRIFPVLSLLLSLVLILLAALYVSDRKVFIQETGDFADLSQAAEEEFGKLSAIILAKEQRIKVLETQLTELNRRTRERLEQADASLKLATSHLADSLADREDQIRFLEVQTLSLAEERKRMHAAATRLRSEAEEAQKAPKPAPAALVEHNAEWKYYIINRGHKQGVREGDEAFVHRGSDFICKMRITQVKDHVSVVEMVKDSLNAKLKPEIGDRIFF